MILRTVATPLDHTVARRGGTAYTYTVKRVVSARAAAKVYYVSMRGGKVVEKVMAPEHIA